MYLRISELVFNRFKYPWYANDFIFSRSNIGKEHDKCLKTIKDFTKKVIIFEYSTVNNKFSDLKVIMERSDDFDETNVSNTKRVAFLDTLLKCKKLDETITFDDIQEEVDTFMFEGFRSFKCIHISLSIFMFKGHDTTAAAASWACHLIGSHPQVQNKIHEELDRVFGNSDRHMTSDDLRELKYLECVIKETLRMFPSVAFFARTVTEDAKCGKYIIGFLNFLFVNIYVIQEII